LNNIIWENFVETLRSFIPPPTLQTLLTGSKVTFPTGPGFPSASQLVALPTSSGLKIYIPTKGDYFYREEQTHEPGVRIMFSNSNTKFGISQPTGFSDQHFTSKMLSWPNIMPVLKLVVSNVMDDLLYFEGIDLS